MNMEFNENVIKNVATEITRECHAEHVMIEPKFVVYLVELLLLNPKYGKIFSRTIKRKRVQYLVEKCKELIMGHDCSLSTLKMQFIIQANYDNIQNILSWHTNSIAQCLRPVLKEILEEEPDHKDDARLAKLFRKISLYIILSSGLGSPTSILTIREGIAALSSVFSLEDLKNFIVLNRGEKVLEINDLVEVVSGVRLFNRDCNKGGDGISDLPFHLVDAGKACLSCLSNSITSAMHRVNTLTTAVEDAITVHKETGNVEVNPCSPDLTVDNYKQIFTLLAFNRQYEVLNRKLLSDVQRTLKSGIQALKRYRAVLVELHRTVKYKAAVPVVTVFPLFGRLWRSWRFMQNVMYIITRVTQLMTALSVIYKDVVIPDNMVQTMLQDKRVMTDQDRMNKNVIKEDIDILMTVSNYVPCSEVYYVGMKDRNVGFLGFCAMCINVGALIPSNMRLGSIKVKSHRYGFCSMKMALKFGKDPQRYINESLEYIRNNPEIINLLNVSQQVFEVKDIDCLVTKYIAETKVFDKDIQTETHPIENNIDKNYIYDVWEWKRRACQWASIVNCQTHSTQTNYSHLRSEIHCQTYEMRDKNLQTKKDAGMNTLSNNVFLWGLRGQYGDNQHVVELDMGESISEKKKAHVISVCQWPCVGATEIKRDHHRVEDQESVRINADWSFV